MALGAASVAIASRMACTSGGLDDLARPQAARAYAQPLDAAIDDGPHRLQVRLEPARADVVGVADGAAHHRALVTDLAALCHDARSWVPGAVVRRRDKHEIIAKSPTDCHVRQPGVTHANHAA